MVMSSWRIGLKFKADVESLRGAECPLELCGEKFQLKTCQSSCIIL